MRGRGIMQLGDEIGESIIASAWNVGDDHL